MRRRNNQNKSTLLLLIFLVLVGVGIAYAVLTEQLTINNTVSYDAMKWDVGFTSAEDGFDEFVDLLIEMVEEDSGETMEEAGITREEFIDAFFSDVKIVTPTTTISDDKKTITVGCDLEMSTRYHVCLVKATISNDSTFNVAIGDMQVSYDDQYISDFGIAWINHGILSAVSVAKGQTLTAGESADVLLFIETSSLTEEMLPSTDMSLPITIDLTFEEADYLVEELSMVVARENDDDAKIWSDTYQSLIKNITFEDKINVPTTAVESWDMSLTNDGRVMAYIVPNVSDSTYYDLYIQSDEQLYANFDMSYWFSDFENVDSISGLDLLDTSFTANMDYMFAWTGKNSSVFNMDVSTLDTSNATSMFMMFYQTGYNSTQFVTSITIRNQNTKDYGNMFWYAVAQSGSQITVNYTSETSDLVDKMIATKSTDSNVVKGVQVD